jgi:hypothetical protein
VTSEPTGSGRADSHTTRGGPGPGPRSDDERSDGPERTPLDVPSTPEDEVTEEED